MVREQLAAHPVYRDLRLVIIGDTISQYPAVRQAVIKSKMEHQCASWASFHSIRCAAFTNRRRLSCSRRAMKASACRRWKRMACGTPVVTSNISSLPEVVGDAAVLVKPENVFDIARGIREVLLDDALRAELIRRGREQAARFSWERTARQVLEIYLEAARGV